jgi:peroxiredoxin-like protein
MNEKHQFEVNLLWGSDRKGTLSSPVLPTQIEVATPPEFDKGIAGIWSPEHLFVASVSSCLMTTFLAVAENSKLEYLIYDCNATGIVGMEEGKYSVIEIILRPRLVIPSTQNLDRAKRILEMSEKACLISNSVKTKITMESTVLFPN